MRLRGLRASGEDGASKAAARGRSKPSGCVPGRDPLKWGGGELSSSCQGPGEASVQVVGSRPKLPCGLNSAGSWETCCVPSTRAGSEETRKQKASWRPVSPLRASSGTSLRWHWGRGPGVAEMYRGHSPQPRKARPHGRTSLGGINGHGKMGSNLTAFKMASLRQALAGSQSAFA